MPTGHTYPVVDGEITTLNEFAAECAKSFLYSAREGNGLAYPSRTDAYHVECVERYQAELSAWDNATEEEKYAQWSEYAAQQEESRLDTERRAKEVRERVKPLLDEVFDLKVPETHKRFKEFMVQQLSDTLRMDGTSRAEYYSTFNYSTWCDNRRLSLVKDIAYHTQRIADEEARLLEARKWIETLANTFSLTIKESN